MQHALSAPPCEAQRAVPWHLPFSAPWTEVSSPSVAILVVILQHIYLHKRNNPPAKGSANIALQLFGLVLQGLLTFQRTMIVPSSPLNRIRSLPA